MKNALDPAALRGVRIPPTDVMGDLLVPDRNSSGVSARTGKTRPAAVVQGRIVIAVDDGLATGATMLAAVRAVRKLRPGRVIVAVPVAAKETCDSFVREVDEIVCAETPRRFQAVGVWYDDFSQTTDQEVREILAKAARDGVH